MELSGVSDAPNLLPAGTTDVPSPGAPNSSAGRKVIAGPEPGKCMVGSSCLQ